jgi:hypothetical protein
MARTTQEIINSMDAEQSSQPDLATLNSPSQTAIYRLWKYIVAKCQNVLEQLWDEKQKELNATVSSGIPTSIYWFRQKCFEFQYDSLVPQVVQLVNMIPTYNPIDASKRIVTRCAVSGDASGVTLKVAKSNPPSALSAVEITALTNYFIASGDGTAQAIGIAPAGCSVTVNSVAADLLYLQGTITYQGQYGGSIQSQCVSAIENFISDLGITANFRIVDLVSALRKVDGFVDIYINNLSWRDAATPFGMGTVIVNSGDVVSTVIISTAGYAIGETTVSNTLNDTINYMAI